MTRGGHDNFHQLTFIQLLHLYCCFLIRRKGLKMLNALFYCVLSKAFWGFWSLLGVLFCIICLILHTMSLVGIKKLTVQNRLLTVQHFHRALKAGHQHSYRTGLSLLQFLTSILIFIHLYFRICVKRTAFSGYFQEIIPSLLLWSMLPLHPWQTFTSQFSH